MFVVKLEIKADSEEEEKKKVQQGTGAVFMDSHVSLQISPRLWLWMSIAMVCGPKLFPVLFFSSLSFLFLPAKCV